MAKLLITRPGSTPMTRHIEEGEARLVIGRQEGCGLRLDDVDVSKEHAVILTVGNDQILEDLGSTNGTVVNGERVARRILQNRDVIEIGAYRLQYVNQRALQNMDFDKTMLYLGETPEGEAVGGEAVSTARDARGSSHLGGLRGLKGRHAGQDLVLDRLLHTLGQAESCLAAVLRRPQGYTLMHVQGRETPRLNGQAIGDEWTDLQSNDMVEVGEDRYTFHPVVGRRGL